MAAAILAVVVAGVSYSGTRSADAQDAPVVVDAHAKIAGQLLKERTRSRTVVGKLRRALRRERRFTSLVRHPSPEHNRALARLLFPEGFWALDKIANGESHWKETVWNGGAEGAFPDRTRAQGSGACLPGNAYGIGQACPRKKMAAWAGTQAIYRINSLQIAWMNFYAVGRYGSLAAAGAHWNAGNSW